MAAVPDTLKPWIHWVLSRDPSLWDRSRCHIDPSQGVPRCAWPGPLTLDLSDGEGRFEQAWDVVGEHWVQLPGSPEHWPQDVAVGGQPQPVVLRGDRPAVKLQAGSHGLSGRFQWPRRPESLMVPAETVLVSLSIDGIAKPWPRLSDDGRLWLRDGDTGTAAMADDQLGLDVYRRIEDSQPLNVATRLELNVSGRAREVALGPVPLPGGTPISLASELPARLEAGGVIRVQVKPGRWSLTVVAYHPGDVTVLERGAAPSEPWPEQEIWAFAAHPELRQVEVSGLQVLDPRQTRLPQAWARLPVYLSTPQGRMHLGELTRGDPDPEPHRLRLARELWLDFDGRGYSVRDRISGELRRGARLDVQPELALGQVTLGGAPQLITRLAEGGPSGVEVRPGGLDLVADGRLEEAERAVSVSGWALSFDGVSAQLHLPPGWDLLAASGVDNVPDTWVYRWTLLDLFLVLIVALGIWRLWGWGWGLLAALTLTLTWQSPGAPQAIWLHVLAAAALLRLLPEAPAPIGLARLRAMVLWYRRLSLLALLVIVLPFLVSEVRGGLYPHLTALSWSGLGGSPTDGYGAVSADGVAGVADEAERAEAFAEPLVEAEEPMPRKTLSAPLAPAAKPVALIDPDALAQTGVGVPGWHASDYGLEWSGPVGENDVVRLWLLTPALNLGRALLGSLLVVVLGLLAAERMHRLPKLAALPALVLSVGLVAGVGPEPVQAADTPSPELLDELQSRLLEPPDCLPSCLDLPMMVIRTEPNRLVLELTLDAVVAVAAPVPGSAEGWLPERVLLDGEALDRIGRATDGQLLVPIPAGRHQVSLEGAMPQRNEVDLPVPVQARAVRLRGDGWRVEGLDGEGRPGRQIQLIRLLEAAGQTDFDRAGDAVGLLLRVSRTLRIGIDWRVETRVTRLSSPELPALIAVPLLAGEAVETPGIQVDDGLVKVGLASGQRAVQWTSRLSPVDRLALEAPSDPRLSEEWSLDLGAMWHVAIAGVPQVHDRGLGDNRAPRWRPLPGERLQLSLTRPAAVPGPTLTIDRVDYRIDPGLRGSDASLALEIRSSQGGKHAVQLPPGAEIRQVAIDGQTLPLSAAQGSLELPITPGQQHVSLTWRDALKLSARVHPEMPHLGAGAVNLSQVVRLPDDRWTLFAAGPGVGPAVLFWGVLLVMIGLAALLGRSRLTPLGFVDWLLLGIGLSLAEVWVVVLVAGWLFALGLRRQLNPRIPAWRFNVTQVGLVLLTLAALAALVGAVQQGLLGQPDMQVVGNGSSGHRLSWYLDRGGPTLPEIWVVSAPIWVYRALMLAWALWLALKLLDWLRWGWTGLAAPQLWKESGKRSKRAPAHPSAEETAS